MVCLRILAAILTAALLVSIATAQSDNSPAPKNIDTLLVYGDGFLFSVKEPDGWHCVCDEQASQYNVNAIVLPSDEQSRAHHVAIKVRVNQKSDENTIEDLKADMQQYRRKYPKVQFADLSVAHPEYKTCAKLFLFPNDFYDYVAYVNPGPRTWFTLSVSMSKEKVPATKAELAAYEKVLQSLNVFTKDVKPPQ
jgi:hypothetical protein